MNGSAVSGLCGRASRRGAGGRALKVLSKAVVTAPVLPELMEGLDNALRYLNS